MAEGKHARDGRSVVALVLTSKVLVITGGPGVGPNLVDLYRQVGTMVGKVLTGTAPADLPVERPARFQLVVNLKTARALGLTIPTGLLIRADEVIE